MTLAVRLGYVQREDAVDVWHLAQEVGKMLRRIAKTLEDPDKPKGPRGRRSAQQSRS